MKYFISKQRYLESHQDDDKEKKRSPSEATSRRNSSAIDSETSNDFNFTELTNGLVGSNDNNAGGFEILNDEGLVNFDDGVELRDVTENHRDMLNSLNEFKE